MLETLKKYLPNASDNVLNALIAQCKTIATDYCNLEQYSTKLDEAVILMVLERYNKLSADGVSSRDFSGISESYTEDFSPMIYKALRKHRKLRTL